MAYSKARFLISALAFIISSAAVAQQQQSQEQIGREIMAMPWMESGSGAISNVAGIEATPKSRVLVGDPASRFIQLSGNPPHEGATIVAPKDLHWFSVYQFHDVGYVTDKDSVDADALMKSLKNEEPADNAEREKMGLDDLKITDWAVKPHYDPATHNLEWGLKIHSSRGNDLINYTTRHLGRGGYVSSILVSDPEHFQRDLAEFRSSDTKLSFNPGSTYAEFRDGDKIAGYGLGALVVGGVTAAAVKSGAAKGLFVGLAAFWKVIAAAFVAAFAGVAKFFRRLFGRTAEE
jgi:uncharacterized membrane-anchored protein